MLRKLVIQNFQAHEKLVIDFDAHVTTIIGPSDVGKSAVIRALRWLATNRPSGEEFIRSGTSLCTVKLYVDKHVIIRERGKTVNRYVLDDVEFKAFGTEPPAEVLKVLNLSPINFQGQHDAPFWFTESPPEISRQLNQIVNLSIIDQTLANLDKVRRESLVQVKLLTQESEDAATLRSGLSWAKAADEVLKSAEELHTVHQHIAEDQRRLTNLVRDVSEYGTSLDRWQAMAVSSGNTILVGQVWDDVQRNRTKLASLLSGARGLRAILSRPIPDVSPLFHLIEAQREESTRVNQLDQRIKDVRKASTDVETAHKEATRFSVQFKKEMGTACALCGKPL